MSSTHPQEKKLKQHFHSPDEKLVAILGRGYLQSFITGHGLTKGLLLLTDRRLYQKGKRYNRTPNGGWSSFTGSAVVDVNDITGTSYLSLNPFGLLWASIISGILVIAFMYQYGLDSLFEGSFIIVLLPLALLMFYFLQKKRLFVVEYGGGSIALDANWFSQAELNEFQKHISLIKGSFRPTITSSKREEISQSSDQADPIQVLKSRLVEGEITPDEYHKMKSILEDNGSE